LQDRGKHNGGDAFVAGYLAETVTGAPPEQRLATAVTTGAFVCTAPGDWEGLPSRTELDMLGGVDVVR
jgi:2-dehydro-3-deoxygluconokinase